MKNVLAIIAAFVMGFLAHAVYVEDTELGKPAPVEFDRLVEQLEAASDELVAKELALARVRERLSKSVPATAPVASTPATVTGSDEARVQQIVDDLIKAAKAAAVAPPASKKEAWE